MLDEAQEKDTNPETAKYLFERCELGLTSMGDDSISAKRDKSALLLRLSNHYAKTDPNHSYEIAQRISSHYDVFEAAKNIQKEHPNFNSDKLNSLFTQAYNAMIQRRTNLLESYPLPLDFNQLLKFIEAFHSVNNRASVTVCMTEASKLVNAYEDDLTRIRKLCEIAECYQKVGNFQKASSSIESAQLLFREKIQPTELIEAHLIFANLFYSLKDTDKMDQELTEVMKLIDTNPPLQTVSSLYSLTKLINTLGKDTSSTSQFKNFEIKSKIDLALQSLMTAPLEDTTRKDRAKAYLNLVSIYNEKLIVDPSSKEQALSKAFELIQKLPETNDKEIKSKFELLNSLVFSYKQDPTKAQEILPIMERLYGLCPLNGDSKLRGDKLGWGQQIMRYYNELKLKEKSEQFFQIYLSDLKNIDESTSSKISNLVMYAKHYPIVDSDHYLPKQREAQLEAAESLLSELKSSIDYKSALADVIEGYLQVDRQRSLQFLKDYSNQLTHQKAMKHLRIAAITAITTVAFCFYPQAYPVLSIGPALAELL
ncbi:MAG TPA: hypothetical protein VFU89_04600 [Rhabdochlamydiaceae bacterium]|nr:hypothetical protein [Rhabdochlamydiaceae bacterium]